MGTEGVKEVGPITVRGFQKATLDRWKPLYGDPVSAEQQGWMSLSPEDRKALEVQVNQIIDTVRADVEGALVVRLKVVPGAEGCVAFTGTARESLGGLVNEKKDTEPKRDGDVVTLTRKGDVIEIRKAA